MNALVYVDIDRAFIKVFSELRSDVIYGWPPNRIDYFENIKKKILSKALQPFKTLSFSKV